MHRLLITAIFACFVVAMPDARAAAAPSDVIREAVDLLTEGLDGRKEELAADKEALYAFIDGILMPRFDRQFAAGAVLGKHWRTASDAQKERFVAAFYTALLHRYADGILEFDTDRVEILPYKGDADKRTTVVKTRVRLDDGTKIPVHYTLVNREDRWRMFDVKIEGVSYVRNYRAEFESEIRSSSLESVIRRLENDAGIAADE
ncbi:MAG: ABC transporter substrate-binding protein [Gammaproteobacteria bacterium]|nr:ABC transporter substrate-binding protein [Gammaproteobacteria bacterium]MDH3372003.1 ABC transporter substrate-binding protein [Gammaproteobacteria bacterium]MDH3408539.1 ABC transporter substrate-binding protein [Gammaproteobacteria bacterium]MDH3552043.1 ABC transporter substrate-binding protein [Gammaproteobacteria bacterium]